MTALEKKSWQMMQIRSSLVERVISSGGVGGFGFLGIFWGVRQFLKKNGQISNIFLTSKQPSTSSPP